MLPRDPHALLKRHQPHLMLFAGIQLIIDPAMEARNFSFNGRQPILDCGHSIPSFVMSAGSSSNDSSMSPASFSTVSSCPFDMRTLYHSINISPLIVDVVVAPLLELANEPREITRHTMHKCAAAKPCVLPFNFLPGDCIRPTRTRTLTNEVDLGRP
jgi:hypothetical protein